MLVHLPPNGVGGVCWLIDSNYFEKREDNSNKTSNTRKTLGNRLMPFKKFIRIPGLRCQASITLRSVHANSLKEP